MTPCDALVLNVTDKRWVTSSAESTWHRQLLIHSILADKLVFMLALLRPRKFQRI